MSVGLFTCIVMCRYVGLVVDLQRRFSQLKTSSASGLRCRQRDVAQFPGLKRCMTHRRGSCEFYLFMAYSRECRVLLGIFSSEKSFGAYERRSLHSFTEAEGRVFSLFAIG